MKPYPDSNGLNICHVNICTTSTNVELKRLSGRECIIG